MKRRVPINATDCIHEEVPDTHDNDDFWEAWYGFLKHRHQPAFKKYPFSEYGARSAFRKLTKVSCDDAILMIQTACEQGWRGFWPLRKDGRPGIGDDVPQWGTNR